MKINVPRETLGRVLGVFILTVASLLLAYVGTAWVWWEWNPGEWGAWGRLVALVIVLALYGTRSLRVTTDEE